MLIGLLGDTHGNDGWIRHAASRFAAAGVTTVIQVGDLGVSSDVDAARKWDSVDVHLRGMGVTLLVAPGNHEDYDCIEALAPDADGWLPFRSRILLAPRGHRVDFGGRTFVFSGGAGSVDRTWREGYRLRTGVRAWWPQEAITQDDVDRVARGGHADVMITHEAPCPVPQIEAGMQTGEFNAGDVAYARQVRLRLTAAVAAVKPDLLVHGHHHRPIFDVWRDPTTGRATRVRGLSLEFDEASVAILDLSEGLKWGAVPQLDPVSGP